MNKPYPRSKTLLKARAQKARLERLATSDMPEAAAKYFEAACQKVKKAIVILEKEAR